MPAADWPALAGGVNPDPWAERDKLTSGEPGSIYDLAGAFENAAREAEEATGTGAQASLQTGEAYRVDGAEVHAVDVETGQTRDLLGGGGQDLEKIGNILRGIGDDLTGKAGSAESKVATLEGTLRTLQNNFAQYESQYQAERANASFLQVAVLDAQYAVAKQGFFAESKAEAQRAGTDIRDNLVTPYDDMLGAKTGELSSLGYTVPGDVNEGPGDVESDPNAGSQDAKTVSEALDLEPGKQSLAEIDAAMGQIRAINEKVANGEALTAEERAYLNQFYNTLGADDLAALPDHLAQANASTVPGAPSDVLDQMTENDLQPFGDSIMNLSQGASYESLPAPVRDLLDTRLGHVDPNTGLRHLNPRMLEPSNYPEGSNPTAYMLGGGVTGQNRLGAITDILNSSEAKPGDGLATHLVDTAIRARQDLNDAQWMAQQGHFRDTGDNFANGVAAMVDDSDASDLLSLAARNNDASSGALLDEDRRAAVLGLNWEDATGATDLVQAGTERDPAEGGGTDRQAAAALAVVQEVGNDRDGYLGRMADPMKDTVNDVGMQWIEAFAEPPVEGNSGVVDNRTDALGRDIGPSFQLTADDRDHFLQFVSGTGDDRAAEFQAQAKIYGQTTVADVLMQDDATPEQLARAMQNAGRLDGAITQANFDYTADQSAGKDAEAAAASRAEGIEARAKQGALNTLAVVGKEALGLVPGGGKLASAGISVATEMVKGLVGIDTLPPAPPQPQTPQTLEDMRREDGTWATQGQNLLLAQAMDSAGLFDDASRPAILTYDGDGDGVIDDPRSNSQNMSTLGPALATELDRWGTAHAADGTTGVVDPNAYLTGRGESFTGAWDGKGTPAESEWHDDRLYYGEATPEGALIPREPDPRKLDDPSWTPPR